MVKLGFSTHGFGVAANFGGEKFRNFIQVNNTESDGYRYNTDYKIKISGIKINLI